MENRLSYYIRTIVVVLLVVCVFIEDARAFSSPYEPSIPTNIYLVKYHYHGLKVGIDLASFRDGKPVVKPFIGVTVCDGITVSPSLDHAIYISKVPFQAKVGDSPRYGIYVASTKANSKLSRVGDGLSSEVLSWSFDSRYALLYTEEIRYPGSNYGYYIVDVIAGKMFWLDTSGIKIYCLFWSPSSNNLVGYGITNSGYKGYYEANFDKHNPSGDVTLSPATHRRVKNLMGTSFETGVKRLIQDGASSGDAGFSSAMSLSSSGKVFILGSSFHLNTPNWADPDEMYVYFIDKNTVQRRQIPVRGHNYLPVWSRDETSVFLLREDELIILSYPETKSKEYELTGILQGAFQVIELHEPNTHKSR